LFRSRGHYNILQCIALQHTSVCCSILQHSSVRCSILQRTATYFSVLQYAIVCCSILQYVTFIHMSVLLTCGRTRYLALQNTTTLCNTLQHSGTHSNTLQRTMCMLLSLALSLIFFSNTSNSPYTSRKGQFNWRTSRTLQHTAKHCNTLQRTTTHCNTLQHTATHCNALQHDATHCTTHNFSNRANSRSCAVLWRAYPTGAHDHCNTLHLTTSRREITNAHNFSNRTNSRTWCSSIQSFIFPSLILFSTGQTHIRAQFY